MEATQHGPRNTADSKRTKSEDLASAPDHQEPSKEIQTKKELIAYRKYWPDSEEKFIFATWLRGLYFGNPWFHEIDRKSYYSKYHKVIEAILESSRVKIACLEEDYECVVGYSVFSDDGELHWIYVRKPWRKLGIAKKLLPEGIKVVTHLTEIGLSLKKKEWIFDPFL